MDAIVTWILGTPINAWVLGTPWVWPTLSILHLAGVSLLLGCMLVSNLRFAGHWRAIELATVEQLFAWAMLALGTCLVTGMLFFFGDPERYVIDTAFQVKAALLVFAGVIAVYFKRRALPRLFAYVYLLTWLAVLLFS